MKLSINETTPPLTPDDDHDECHPTRIRQRESFTLPSVEKWRHRPLMICANTSAAPSLQVPEHGMSACPLGVPFKFSSDVFEGEMLIRLKDSKSDNVQDDEAYFSGRKRSFQSVVQGRFKEQVPVGDVLTGYEFARPLKSLPSSMILKLCSKLATKIAPGVNINFHCDQPHLSATLCGASKTVRADKPGSEPDITDHDIQEDCTLFGDDFEKEEVSALRRKRIFSSVDKCQNYTFDTETVYTFEFYEHMFCAQKYLLDVGFTSFEVCRNLDGQPLQRLAKMKDGRYLWSFQIWHEKLLANTNGGKSILLED